MNHPQIVYSEPVNSSNQLQVVSYIVAVPNNFPDSRHISPAVAQVEKTLNLHYAQQKQQNYPPAYANHQF